MKLTKLIPKVSVPERVEYPMIDPVPEGVHRPFWSVMIPTYNRARYLEQTLKSVLEQDPGPDEMQIEVIDNCSTQDGIEAVVRKIGQNRIFFYRQSSNVGMSTNWTTCIKRAHGYWVHILHDDDVVVPGFYQAYERLIQEYPNAVLLTGPTIYIDEHGQQIGISEAVAEQEGPVNDFVFHQATRNWIRTPSVVVARSVYEKVGGFCHFLTYTADWEMFFRAGMVGKVITTTIPYSLYRIHAGSDTNRLVATGRNIEEAVLAVELCCRQLPDVVRRKLSRSKYQWVAGLAEGFSYKLAQKKHWEGSLVQAAWALRLHPTKEHLKMWIGVLGRFLFQGRSISACL